MIQGFRGPAGGNGVGAALCALKRTAAGGGGKRKSGNDQQPLGREGDKISSCRLRESINVSSRGGHGEEQTAP